MTAAAPNCTLATQRLETPRLVLRPLTLDDAAAIQEILGDERVARTMAIVPHPMPDGEAARFIGSVLDGTRVLRAHWAITLRETGVVIGALSLRPVDDHLRIGYYIGPDHWRNGYAREAVGAATHAAFESDVRLGVIEAGIHADNPASEHVVRACGFAFVGASTEPGVARGGPVASRTWRLHRAAWEARKQ